MERNADNPRPEPKAGGDAGLGKPAPGQELNPVMTCLMTQFHI